jgi:hypothetical protein
MQKKTTAPILLQAQLISRHPALDQSAPEVKMQFSKVGDRAKPLNIAAWVNGRHRRSLPSMSPMAKNIYVVEFLGHLVGPCKTSIPHTH